MAGLTGLGRRRAWRGWLGFPIVALIASACLTVTTTGLPTGAPTEGTATPDVRGEAARACPETDRDACVEALLEAQASGLPSILCLAADGGWSIGVPGRGGAGREVGEACADGGTIVLTVNTV
jgi:hypothetical protein